MVVNGTTVTEYCQGHSPKWSPGDRVFNALRKDEGLRDEFLMFMRARGSSLSLTLERLRTVWWKSRRSMYPGFLVLAAVEFGFAHGLLVLEGGKKPLR